MTGLLVKEVLRLREGEPGGVEAILLLWWVLLTRAGSNYQINSHSLICCVNTFLPNGPPATRWSREQGCQIIGQTAHGCQLQTNQSSAISKSICSRQPLKVMVALGTFILRRPASDQRLAGASFWKASWIDNTTCATTRR